MAAARLTRVLRPALAVSLAGAAAGSHVSLAREHPAGQPRKEPAFESFLEHGGIQFAIVGGSCAIAGFLLLAIRDTRRMERVSHLFKSANQVLNSSPAIARSVGRVYAAGQYKMTISDVVAKGTYAVEAPSRSVTGTATIDAWRAAKSDPWAFNALSIEFDAAAVASANAERDAVAARAGYSDGASDQAEATVNPGEKLVIRVV